MTTTMGEVTETTSLEELLDFDVMCGYLVNYSTEDCPNAAKYNAETKCCGYSSFLCQEHLDLILNSEITKSGFGCAHCNHIGWFHSIEEWLTIIPI